jgi:excisionase family DNA binding protein
MNNLSKALYEVPQARLSAERIWNTDEAAEYLRISPRTLTRMARRAEVPSIQIGRLWRFRRADLDDWLTRKVNSVSYPCRLNS